MYTVKGSKYWILVVGLLAACKSASTPVTVSQEPSDTPQPTKTIFTSATPTIPPTDTPTNIPTITPIPCLLSSTSVSEYEWCPENVLLQFDISPGDGGGDINVPSPPNLILYGDGSLFITHSELTQDRYRTQILFKKLDRQEICQHLNTFEKIGYFNYDPSSYQFI